MGRESSIGEKEERGRRWWWWSCFLSNPLGSKRLPFLPAASSESISENRKPWGQLVVVKASLSIPPQT